MSIDRCSNCGRNVDTDTDDDCYQPDPRMSLKGYPDICICKWCRDWDDDEALRVNDEPPSNANVLPMASLVCFTLSLGIVVCISAMTF